MAGMLKYQMPDGSFREFAYGMAPTGAVLVPGQPDLGIEGAAPKVSDATRNQSLANLASGNAATTAAYNADPATIASNSALEQWRQEEAARQASINERNRLAAVATPPNSYDKTAEAVFGNKQYTESLQRPLETVTAGPSGAIATRGMTAGSSGGGSGAPASLGDIAIGGGGGGGGTGIGSADTEIGQAGQANQIALDNAKQAGFRSSALFNQAIPGLEKLSTDFYNPALEGNFQQTPLGRNMQLEIMRQMEKSKNRQRVSGAMSGRSAQETDALMGGVDTAAAQSLANVPLAGMNQAQGYFTGLAGLAQGIAPNNVNIQTPGTSLVPQAANYANQYGYGTSLADLPYYLS